MELGNASGAVIALRNVVRLRENDAEAWYCLAQSYRQLRYAAAFIRAERQLLELDPRRADDLAVDLQRGVQRRRGLPASQLE
jgi:Flp pilus assembly protein TadD